LPEIKSFVVKKKRRIIWKLKGGKKVKKNYIRRDFLRGDR
jgi:hypothetical protein